MHTVTWGPAHAHQVPESQPVVVLYHTAGAHWRQASFLELLAVLSICPCDRSPPKHRKHRDAACPKTTDQCFHTDPTIETLFLRRSQKQCSNSYRKPRADRLSSLLDGGTTQDKSRLSPAPTAASLSWTPESPP